MTIDAHFRNHHQAAAWPATSRADCSNTGAVFSGFRPHAIYARRNCGFAEFDLLTIAARSPEDTSRYLYLDTLAGFNAGGWIVRSKQILNIFSGKSQFAHLYGYAQRTLADYPAVVQVGQI